MAPRRHLDLLGATGAEKVVWPVPFADGVEKLLSFRGRKVVVLASGDPFWFGAGSVLARELSPDEWQAYPNVSVFSLAAARLGWPLEKVLCRGLHAAPFERLRPDLAPGVQIIATLRDGEAAAKLASWLNDMRFGATNLHVLEALGGPRERVRICKADGFDLDDVQHPVAVAFEVAGDGPVLHGANGQPDDFIDHDGQITKRPVRALTLSALAPRPGERLWDIGAGSGSISFEWLMTHPTTEATAIETRADRAAQIRENARALGLDRLHVVEGGAPDVLDGLELPDVVFVGGGLNADLLQRLEALLLKGTRLVANAVTLDTEALLVEAQGRLGGSLLKVELSEAQPLGRFRGWKASYPVVQWSVTL